MVEVKIVEQGVQWANMIVPLATLLASGGGVYYAYWLHSKKEQRQLKREKAEQIIRETNQVKDLLTIKGGIDYVDIAPTKTTGNGNYLVMEQLFNSIKAQVEIFFPEFLSSNKDQVDLQRLLSTKQEFLETLEEAHFSKHAYQEAVLVLKQGKPVNLDENEKQHNVAKEKFNRAEKELKEYIEKFKNKMISKARKTY